MSTKTIIAVDDEPDIRVLVCCCLESNGDFEVLEAKNGEEAITLAISHRPALIVMDVRMPRMDGIEACRRLKADPATADITIVILSAKGQESDIHAGNEAGADDYFTKPFSPLALINKVEQVMGERG